MVKYKLISADQNPAFETERSLDTIMFPGLYSVEIIHNGTDVGLPVEDCGDEHYIVGNLMVTDSGTLNSTQDGRVIGQVLTFTTRSSKETKVYSRTFVDGGWSTWRSLAHTGMFDDISTSDELVSTVEALVTESKRARAAVDVSSLQSRTDEKNVVLTATSIDGENNCSIELPSATTEFAGVMSAEDKEAVNAAKEKGKHVNVVIETSDDEEVVFCNDTETDVYATINSDGVIAKKFKNLEGEEFEYSGVVTVNDNPNELEICDDNQTPILVIDEDGNLNTSSFSSFGTITNLFKGKTMLYIGDSISTGNVWHWKGYIQEKIGLKHVKYASEDTTNVTPAVGGITIRPHNDDDTRPMNAGAAEVGSSAKSIWWRCCNKRLNTYDFDYINLFGGTNDIYDENLYVGTIDDTPLLDTDVDDLTTLDLSQVSFASAFMGCIEMLRRDFPNKPLFICTLLVNGYSKTPDVVKIQMLAAQKYGLKVVPFYYSELNSQNYQYLCNGFHPNQIAARIMEKNFIEYINL